MDKKLTDKLSNNSPILSNGLSDSEIVKALECCSMQSYPACCECPYHEQYSNKGCITKRNADIADLINRQKAEIDGLQQLVNLSIDMQNEMTDTIINLEELLAEKNAEIERLEDLLKRHQRNTDRIRLITAETAKKIKAEAYKEFAERLKDMHKCNTTSVVSLVTVFDNINNLVKELIGE